MPAGEFAFAARRVRACNQLPAWWRGQDRADRTTPRRGDPRIQAAQEAVPNDESRDPYREHDNCGSDAEIWSAMGLGNGSDPGNKHSDGVLTL